MHGIAPVGGHDHPGSLHAQCASRTTPPRRSYVFDRSKWSSAPLTGNNSADLEIDYDTSIAKMTADIRTARESVHVLFYIMALDEITEDFFEALAEPLMILVHRSVKPSIVAARWNGCDVNE